MKYRNEFPRNARARVEAETLRAYEALEQDIRGRLARVVPFRRRKPRGSGIRDRNAGKASAHDHQKEQGDINERAWGSGEHIGAVLTRAHEVQGGVLGEVW
jgi:hypothetical protein